MALLMELPQRLVYDQILPLEENNQIEFKAVQYAKHPLEAISRYAREYLNAFLNSHGGQIWFGIEDNQKIKGLLMNDKLREQISLAIDGAVAAFVPQVDSSLYKTTFIPVETKSTGFDAPSQFSRSDDDSSVFITNKDEKWQLLVTVVTVLPGTAPMYYTAKQNDTAFFRRDGGITKMTPETIIQRVQEGRSTQGIKPMTDELDFTCRKQTIAECIAYLQQEHPPTKILLLYGLASVGKSRFAEHLRQLVASDRKYFPVRRKTFSVDLKGSYQKKFRDQCDVVLELIHSMRPEFSLDQNEGIGISSPDRTFSDDRATYWPVGTAESENEAQPLLKIYFSILREVYPILLICDNAGGCPYIQELFPTDVDMYIIVISRTQIVLRDLKPFYSFKQIALQPLSDDEGAILIMSILGISAEEGRSISRLCAGLPQAIRMICRNCKMYGVPPMQVVLNLNKTLGSSKLAKIQPQLYSLLSGLQAEQLYTLAAVSIFPCVFYDEAVVEILEGYPTQYEFTQSRFSELTNLGLIDKVQEPCNGLRHQNWWKITEAIREFAYNNIKKEAIRPTIKAYVTFFVRLLETLAAQFGLDYPNKSSIFRKATREEIVRGTYDLFLAYNRAFSLAFQAINRLMQDPRYELVEFGRRNADIVLGKIGAFANFYTQQMCKDVQAMRQLLARIDAPERAELLDLDLDFEMWRILYQ